MPQKQRHLKSQHLNKIRHRKWKVICLVILSIAFVLLIYWFLFLSDFFQIKHLILNPEPSSDLVTEINNYFDKKNQKFVPFWLEAALQQVGISSLSQRNLLFFSQADLANYLMQKHPELAKVEAKLDLNESSLTVTVSRRQNAFLVCHQEQCYEVDGSGILFAKAPEISGNFGRKIVILNFEPQLGQKIWSEAEANAFQNLFNLAENPASPFKIKYLELEETNSPTLKIITEEGWYLLVNFNSDFQKISEIIQGLFNSQLKNKTSDLKYLDCRYLPRVYYYLE